MKDKRSEVVKGVADAWDFWLSQHDVSTPQCIVEGVQKAVESHLRALFDTEALAAAIARQLDFDAAEACPNPQDHERWFYRAPCCGSCPTCGSSGCLVFNDDVHPEVHTCAAGCQCPPECNIHHEEPK